MQPVRLTLMAIIAKMADMATPQRNSQNQRKTKDRKQSRRIAPETARSENREARAGSVTATDAKNEFARVLESVIRGNRVFITKHDAPKAVLISIDEFEA